MEDENEVETRLAMSNQDEATILLENYALAIIEEDFVNAPYSIEQYAMMTVFVERPVFGFTQEQAGETMGNFAERNAINFARLLRDAKKANCIVMDYLFRNKVSGLVDAATLSDNTKIKDVTWA